MWLQKDEYDASHPERRPGVGTPCPYPVHSIKQKRMLETAAASSPASSPPVMNNKSNSSSSSIYNLADMCVTGSSMTSVKYFKATPATAADSAGPNDTGDTAGTNGGVRSILNILDSFKIGSTDGEVGGEAKSSPSDGSISVVESSVLITTPDPADPPPVSSKLPDLAAKKDSVTESGGQVVNQECLIINGMSQGDRLQQIKSLRRQHARATTTGALKWVTLVHDYFLGEVSPCCPSFT